VCTPPELLQKVVYQVYPSGAADWVRDKGLPQPPTELDGPCGGTEMAGDVAIADPIIGQRVTGGVQITGNARAQDFRAYKLELAPENTPNEWTQIGPEHYEQVTNGPLEFWDTTGFDGLYYLRLVVMENNGGTQETATQVVVDNNPPEVAIVHPENDQKYVMEDDELVSITADAQDDWEMDRVEFFMDEQKLGESTVAPYSLRWTITMSDGTIGLEEYIVREVKVEPYTADDGTEKSRIVLTTESGFGSIYESGVLTETHTIYVKAYDRAGNEAKSEPVRFLVMHKPKEKKTSLLLGEPGLEISDQGVGVRMVPVAAPVRAPVPVS
jgi:hypothetical protein